uniref:Hatching enzyme n=1 Tax=Lygus hesperus TaxID=30085 RepID=A0A0A9WHE5_LYGHE
MRLIAIQAFIKLWGGLHFFGLCSVFSFAASEPSTFVIEYLRTYGYLSSSYDVSLTKGTNGNYSDTGLSEIEVQHAITLFQEMNHLRLKNGSLDEATLKLMSSPRCGLQDTLQPFTANLNRMWFNNSITWYAYGNLSKYMHILEKAFGIWAEYTTLNFIRSPYNPLILLTMSAGEHIVTNLGIIQQQMMMLIFLQTVKYLFCGLQFMKLVMH